ncbi:MFS transporter [Ketogulonicigenium vulgare]|uniref:Transmembrane efflux protein n=2 Tax=Ketogulonicigenium vulgare TaxID=92945 RepID=F9YBC6_KETVW|nr:MFS transporter [Ketogulonicigenium vulgare]AEM42678.1 transmembrane efflux protein [Ketogulonicigenium vulgare WSH-001]ALJ82483.1 MFS transporter [Ketogulonicigenium vulgare]ANW35267.1 MFS transporter [Ketogulonicigenium vulgare]AOZ53379.1 transmembrane efflux protein [Ketogulonicigenium vulgare]
MSHSDPATLQDRAQLQRAVLIVVLTTYMMIILDTSIVITGLPEIGAGLGFSPTGLSWVQNAYTLAFGGFMLLGARAGDILGRRRVYLAGLVLFALASLVIGLAPNPATLLAARIVQGAGAAVLAPTTLSLLALHFAEGPERNRAFAQYAAAAGVGSSLGLVLGGIFAGWMSWRVGFLVNAPVAALLYIAARRLLADDRGNGGGLDLIGALISTLGMGGLVYGIVRSAEVGWRDGVTVVSIVAGLGLIAAFLITQARAAQPLLPLHLFADRIRIGAYLARALFLGAMVSFFFFSTQLMQAALHMTPVAAGLGFLPMTVLTLAASLTLPRLVQRFGNGAVVMLAFAFIAAGLLWLAQAGPDDRYMLAVGLPMLLVGIGNGLGLGPLTALAMQRIAAKDAGAAAGVVNVAHQLGGTVGLAILVTVFAAAMRAAPVAVNALQHGVTAGLHGAALLAVGGMIACAILIIPANRRGHLW